MQLNPWSPAPAVPNNQIQQPGYRPPVMPTPERPPAPGGNFSLPMAPIGALMAPAQNRPMPGPGFSPGFRPQVTPGPWGRSVASAPGGIGQNYMRNFAQQFGGGQNALGLFGGGDPTMAIQNAFGIRGVTPEMLMRYMQGGYNPQQVANYLSRNTM